MADDFFNNGDKAYSENLNDAILVGNSFDWMVSVDLPSDTEGVFPNSSSVVKAKVCDVSAAPNSNLGIGSAISNNSGSEQVYRLTVYPNFNRFGGFASVSLTADSGVSFYLANKGASSPIVSNLDYSDLGSVPELKVLKEYDIVITIPSGKSVSGLSFVLQSKSASVSASISQGNVAGLLSSLSAEASARESADANLEASKVDKVTGKGLSTNDFTTEHRNNLEGIVYQKVALAGIFPATSEITGSYEVLRFGASTLYESFSLKSTTQVLMADYDYVVGVTDYQTGETSTTAPSGLVDLVTNHYSSISFSKDNLELKIIDNKLYMRANNVGVYNWQITYNTKMW